MAFKAGDLAVYPAHGVGRIESVETKDISGLKQSFYIMRILENDMIIMIPTANADSVGLREIISPESLEEIFGILGQRDVPVDTANWNRRYREYTDKIKTGSIFEVALVMRDLTLLKNHKELSFGERKLLDTARALLIKELAVAQQAEAEKVEQDLDALFDS